MISSETLKIRSLAAAAVLLFFCQAQETGAGSAYLKEIGPSPLRFSFVAAIPASLILPDSLIERQAPTNKTEISATTITSADTNAIVGPPAPASIPTAQSIPEPQTSSVPAPSASDLLPVSPQMLTEFFKPVGNRTNSPGTVIVPVPVGFTPPSVQPAPSRATYTSP